MKSKLALGVFPVFLFWTTLWNTKSAVLVLPEFPSLQQQRQRQRYISKSPPQLAMVGFTDRGYVRIAKAWYHRLIALGYQADEIIIACNDEESYQELLKDNITSIEECFIPQPDRRHPVRGFWQQLMKRRLEYTYAKLEKGTSLLVTDIDNVFMRHVPLYELWHEPFDVMHAYAIAYPVFAYRRQGFVVCSGHQWLRATNATLAFLRIVMEQCENDEKCDDQVAYNAAMVKSLQMDWHIDATRPEAPRIVLNDTSNAMHGKLVEELTGRSRVTNHTVKVWSRDFATRWQGDPEYCPSEHNWVAMPAQMSSAVGDNKVDRKIAAMDLWARLCGANGTIPKRILTA